MPEIIVWVILLNDEKVFLIKKIKNDSNEWTVVGGHVERNESLKQALKREIMEEIGVIVEEKDLIFQCVIDRKLNDAHRIHFFFKATEWQGRPQNKEQHIHSAGEWHDLNNLPNTIGPLATLAIQSLKRGEQYHEYGFNK
jgi:8-oxo-dGTP diphosphatase